MYVPEQFREDRAEILRAFIARHPLGALVAASAEGLVANHIPMLWRAAPDTPGILGGHVAKANPLWRLLTADTPVLVIFSGATHYITPSWYPGKVVHGKVVPTWNYSVVHAHGTIRFFYGLPDALTKVRQLTEEQEAARPAPWAVSDAPADYLESQLKHIIPFEIALTRLEGKFKASQHRPPQERVSVAAALQAEGLPPHDIAELVREPRPR
jgi:transcriptional regulator